MKILVINTGSSSIKYQLFDLEDERVLASGLAEKIGEETSVLTHKGLDGQGRTLTGRLEDHQQGFDRIVALLTDPDDGVIKDKAEITAVGHRVVHGGETFKKPTLIDDQIIEAIKRNIPLAPLHNPSNLEGIKVARSIFPRASQAAVFDTAFHQTIPARAFLYALPYDLYEKHQVRKYGFHGTSHAYVTEKAAEHLEKPVEDLKIITVHLGNGASMAAVKSGRCVDTTMGMTPLAGLVMGTRCGDIDPALPFFLADHLNMSLQEIDALLNKESGLKGICRMNDMREVLAKREEGDPLADLAVEVYAYRIRKYIGAYFAALGGLDVLVFTAGVGENSPEIRQLCCQDLEGLGLVMDPGRNQKREKGVREINAADSRVKILVVPTNEELKIARETQKILPDRPANGKMAD